MPTKRRNSVGPAAISGQLREIIAGRNLTAYSLAQAAEVSPSVISRFLSRERGLTLETFDAIAGALGLRLVETGRGRGRPTTARRAVPPAVPSDTASRDAIEAALAADEGPWANSDTEDRPNTPEVSNDASDVQFRTCDETRDQSNVYSNG